MDTLHLISSFLLFDGRRHEVTFHQMNDEGAFPRLLELIQIQRRKDEDNGAGLGRLLMDLLYEMSRIQRVKIEDLGGCIIGPSTQAEGRDKAKFHDFYDTIQCDDCD